VSGHFVKGFHSVTNKCERFMIFIASNSVL